MKIRAINEVRPGSGLWHYQYITEDGEPISAVFQASERWLCEHDAVIG